MPLPQVATQTPPAPPALPAVSPSEQAITQAAQGLQTIPRPMSRAEIAALRAARSELSNQLTSAEGRRSRLVEELRGTEGQVRAGLEQRIAVLDERIVQVERDIAATGRQLSDARALVGTTEPARGAEGFRMDPDLVVGVSSVLMFVFLAPVALAWMRMLWRRSGRTPQARPDAESTARLERIEQAVDAIAIEVERVSESQRYQAKLLSEGQGAPIFAPGTRAPDRVRVDG